MLKYKSFDEARYVHGYYTTFLTKDEYINQDKMADYKILVNDTTYYIFKD